jgi:hypothetical protein
MPSVVALLLVRWTAVSAIVASALWLVRSWWIARHARRGR